MFSQTYSSHNMYNSPTMIIKQADLLENIKQPTIFPNKPEINQIVQQQDCWMFG